MQGKILTDGLIGGNDGNRYTYTASDLKNAQGKSINAIIGSEVDFVGKDGKASEIYITKETKTLDFDVSKAKSKIKSAFTGLAKIQKLNYAMVACLVLLPVVGFVFALVFGILATKELCKLTHRALMKKFITLFVLVWIICVLSSIGSFNAPFMGGGRAFASPIAAMAIMMANMMMIGAVGLSIILKVIPAILVIPTFFVLRAYTRELVSITQQRYFNFVLYFGTVGLLPLPFVSTILSLIALGFYVVAWAKTTELGKTHTAVK